MSIGRNKEMTASAAPSRCGMYHFCLYECCHEEGLRLVANNRRQNAMAIISTLRVLTHNDEVRRHLSLSFCQ